MQFLDVDRVQDKITLDEGSQVAIGNAYFGEGVTRFGDKYIQLTWKEGKIFEYDLDLKLIDTKTMPSALDAGWGLTSDDKYLYMSDGTYNLFVVNPETYEIINTMQVKTEHGFKRNRINELELSPDG